MAIYNITKQGGPGYFPIPEGCQYFTDFSFAPGLQAVDLTDFQATTSAVAIANLDRTSPLGTGAQIDGTTTNYGYVLNHKANHNLDNGSGFTIYAFVKRTGNNSGVRQIFNKQFTTSATAPFLDWMLALKNNNFEVRIGNSFLSTTIGLTQDVWHSMVLTGDGTNWRFYLDGILQQTSGVATIPTDTNGITPRIGHVNFTGTPSEVFLGVISQAGIWNRALSQQEVLTLDRHARGEIESVIIEDPLGATPAAPIVQGSRTGISVRTFQSFVSTNTPGATLTAQTHVIAPGNDSVYRSIDPSGLALKPTTDIAPIIDKTLLTNGGIDQFVTNGGTFTYTPTLVNAPNTYNFYLDCHPDEATIDSKTGQVTLDTSTLPLSAGVQPDTVHYLMIKCKNSAGEDKITIRLHIGITSSDVIYVGSGETYTTVRAACDFANANSNIKRIIIRNGIYTGPDNLLSFLSVAADGFSGYHAPGGTAQQPFWVCAETPFGVALDGESQNRVLQIVGNVENPDFPRGGNFNDGNFSQNHLHFLGIRTENTFRGSFFRSSEYNIFRFCDFGSVSVLELNTICGSGNSAQKTLIEYCYSYGWSRYLLAMFENMDCAIRRSVTRYCGYSSGLDGTPFIDPSMAGHTMYRVQRAAVQNCGVLDSDDENIWESKNNVINVTVSHQSTVGNGPNNYTENLTWSSNWAVNVFNGGIGNFSPTQNASTPTRVNDFIAYGTVFPDFSNSNSGGKDYFTGFFGRGVHIHDGVSYINCNLDTTGELAGALFRTEQDVQMTNFIFDDAGGTSTLGLFVSWGQPDPTTVDNFSAFGWTNSLGVLGDIPTFTNRQDFEMTEANGFKYIPRMETGSPINTAGVGSQSVEFCVGKLGAYYEDPDFDTVTTTPVFPYRGLTEAMQYWRARTTTFPTQATGPNATEDVSGNFGVARVNDDPNYYVWAQAGNVPFPFYVNSRAEGSTSVYLSWDIPAKLYFDTYVKFFVHIKNVTDGEIDFTRDTSVNRFDNSVVVSGLTAGKTYDFAITAIDLNSRETALSYSTRVSL